MPHYTKSLPDDAMLNSTDIAAIFGYKSNGSLKKAIDKGFVPEPDSRMVRTGRSKRLFWSISLLRKLENDNK